MRPWPCFRHEGSRLVWVEYGPEEYRALWGGSEEDYLEYLAEVTRWHMAVVGGLPVIWLVRVPFDFDDYSAWAENHPDEAAGPEAHTAWASDAARSPERLSLIRARHRHKSCVPQDELFAAKMMVWCLPVVLHGSEELRRLAAPLPDSLLEEVTGGLFAGVWRGAPPFERLSARRASGFAAVPGNRLIPARRSRKLNEATRTLAAQLSGSISSSFAVPNSICITRTQPFPLLELLALPFLLLGSELDVETGASLAQFSKDTELPIGVWARFFGELGVTFPGEFAGNFLPSIYSPEFFEEGVKADIWSKLAAKRRRLRGRLKRLK